MTHEMPRGVHFIPAQEIIWWEVAAEMHKQDQKWGQQDHPMIPYRGGISDPLAGLIASANHARMVCELTAERGEVTWANILIEEVAEFCDAPTIEEMRKELVQVAAVVHQAIAAIDRAEAQG